MKGIWKRHLRCLKFLGMTPKLRHRQTYSQLELNLKLLRRQSRLSRDSRKQLQVIQPAKTLCPEDINFKQSVSANKMAQWVKGLASEPDNLSLILGVYMVEGENQFCNSPSSFQSCLISHIHTCTLHTHKSNKKVKLQNT